MVTFCYFCTLSTIYFKYTQLLCYYLSSKTDKIRISIILHNWYLGRISLLNIHFLQFLPRFFGNWYNFDVHRLHKIGDYTKRWMSYLGDHQSTSCRKRNQWSIILSFSGAVAMPILSPVRIIDVLPEWWLQWCIRIL